MKRSLTRVVIAVCMPVGLMLSACGFGGFTHSSTTDVPAPAGVAGATESPAATETSPTTTTYRHRPHRGCRRAETRE